MKKIKLIILAFFISSIFITKIDAQRSYAMKIHNQVQINESTLRFDISLRNTAADPVANPIAIEILEFQVQYNQGLRNGGIFQNSQMTYIANSTEFAGTKNNPTTTTFTHVYGTNMQAIGNLLYPDEVTTFLDHNNWVRIGTYQVLLRTASSGTTAHNFRSVIPNLTLVNNANYPGMNHCDYYDDGTGTEYYRLDADFYPITSKAVVNECDNKPLYGYAYTGSGNWSTAANWNTTLPAGHPNKGVVPNWADSSISIGKLTNVATPVEVPGTCVMDADGIVKDVTIRSTSKLTINAGKGMDVRGTAYVPAATNLVLDGTAAGSGNWKCSTTDIPATVKRWMKSNGTSYWNYLSSPISGTSSSLYTSPTRSLYYADEPTNVYLKFTNAAPGTLQNGRGYGRKVVSGEPDADAALTQTGVLIAGTYSQPLTRTVSMPTNNQGWNLLGNPYPCALDWTAASGWTKTNIINGINMSTGTGTLASYVDGVGSNGGTQFIPSQQGFWVRVADGQTSGSLAFSDNVKVLNAQNLYKENNDAENNTLRLTVMNLDNSGSDETVIRFKDYATDNFDNMYDAYKLFANEEYNLPQLYTSINDEFISINTQSALSGERTVPVGFKTTEVGTYTFYFNNVQNLNQNGNVVYFKDLETGACINIANESEYTFTSNATNTTSRFLLLFNPANSVSENVGNGINIFSNNNQIVVKGIENLNGMITVYDLLGNVVVNSNVNGSKVATISVNTSSSVYLVKFTSNNQTITKKVVINK